MMTLLTSTDNANVYPFFSLITFATRVLGKTAFAAQPKSPQPKAVFIDLFNKTRHLRLTQLALLLCVCHLALKYAHCVLLERLGAV